MKTDTTGCDKMSNGIEFHSSDEAIKKECLNALMVEDIKFKVKECDLVANVLKWKYLEKSMAVVLCKIQYILITATPIVLLT